MTMIFPGMDPYLENPALWPGVHNRFIIYLADALQPAIGTRYIAAVEERVFIEGPQREFIPDVSVRPSRDFDAEGSVAVIERDAPVVGQTEPLEIHETYLNLLDLESGQNIVCVIELLSPANKHAGPGRESYLRKQTETLASGAHLIEIDLLRAGQHALAVPELLARRAAHYDYLVSVSRAGGDRTRFETYPFTLGTRLPRIRVPLADGDPDAGLDLQAVWAKTYAAGTYRQRIRYERAPVPALPHSDRGWADGLIAATA